MHTPKKHVSEADDELVFWFRVHGTSRAIGADIFCKPVDDWLTASASPTSIKNMATVSTK